MEKYLNCSDMPLKLLVVSVCSLQELEAVHVLNPFGVTKGVHKLSHLLVNMDVPAAAVDTHDFPQ